MRNQFDKKLEELNKDLIKMCSLIETAISKAIRAIKERNVELAQEVVMGDVEVNELELDIERKSLRILLSEQPVAKDLRTISTALKMITDMERICDQAADIAEIVTLLKKEDYDHEPKKLVIMAEKCVIMVSRTVDAFITSDLELAKEIERSDDEIDALFDEIKQELIEDISKDASRGGTALDYLMITKYLERIGDHATNIAQWVQFNITGQHKDRQIL